MGILSSSTALTRYRIVETVPKGLWGDVQERLERYSFQDIDATAEEQAFGWVCFDNMLDPEWASAPPQKGGEHLAFGLRLDTRRIPASVMKKHYRIGLEELEQKNKERGNKYVGREQKQELREQTKLRLLARVLPVPAVFDVVWNTSTNRVYFASTRDSMQDLFEDLFTRTFGLHLEPLTPYYLALASLGQEGRTAVEAYEPGTFI